MISNVQKKWNDKILSSLSIYFNEFDSSITKLRSTSQRDQYSKKWHELSTIDLSLDNVLPVFSHKDFLDAILTVFNFDAKIQNNLEFSKLDLKTKCLLDLKDFFSEISENKLFLGLNCNNNLRQKLLELERERLNIGQSILNSKNKNNIRNFLKKGCPCSMRKDVWSVILNSDSKIENLDYYNGLKKEVIFEESILDNLIIKDIQLTASNDDQYFVFEDILYQVELCFFRDDYNHLFLLKHWLKPLQLNTLKNLSVIPFHGFSMYGMLSRKIAPFCFLYEDPTFLYFVFRKFYFKYICPLCFISDHPQGILSCCSLFEKLLQNIDFELWLHFNNNNVHPIRVAFKWLLRMFSGYLPPDQLLLLWDLVIAYNSIDVVPLLAATILHFRRQNLLQVQTQAMFEKVLSDLSTVSVYALLQLSLA